MFTVMESEDSDRIKELKLTAKWSTENREKKKAIFELSRYGQDGVSAIQEILGVTAYADVKQACLDAIKMMGGIQTRTLPKVEMKKITKDNPKRKKTIAKRKSKKAKS